LAALAQRVGRVGHDDLHRWSVEQPGELWSVLWEHLGVLGDPGETAFDPGDGSFLGARFFPDARLSFTENLLGHAPSDDGPALIAVREGAADRTWTWVELRADVAAAAAALRADGVRPGDRVAAWMPNVGETVVVMLATLSLGAVFTSTSPDFGTMGVLDRFGQVEPTVLLVCDGYRYGGKEFSLDERLAEVVAGLPSLRRVVVVPVLGSDPGAPVGQATRYEDWLAPHQGAELALPRFPFDQPGFVLYSSGTTGPPKCIVHRAAGVLVTHMKEHQLMCDVRPGDRVLYVTTCGWMMWNWLTSVLASGATAVLYDGNPMHPTPDVLFDVVDRYDVTLFGLSAKLIDAYRKADLVPRATHRLAHLRTICSTGSPLSVDGFRYVYGRVHPDVHLASISGGTDLCGCLVGGDPTRPVWAGEIQGSALGMDIDVVDDEGSPCPPGPAGELICRRPFPSVPLGFWGDDGSKFRGAYFERFEGVWAHGDFASWTPHGGVVIHGRSDATLNANGVRIGTAELYRVVEQLDEVAECIAVGQPWDGDTRIVLFVRLAAGVELDDALRDRIRTALRTQCSPRHVPAVIEAVADIPRTRSGKISELAVADVVSGRPVRNTEALANPEALAYFTLPT
jgi:acetoacetyl-CoA synthetase